MRVLVTGSAGFIGRNLCETLKQQPQIELLEADVGTSHEELSSYVQRCDFIYHLAGVNRPVDENDFFVGNVESTRELISLLDGRRVPIVLTSSTQATKDNAYGRSKLAAENALRECDPLGELALIYRLPNVFGKWSRPNYNTVVATFCNNAARGVTLTVNDPEAELTLCYIDDVVDEFIRALYGQPTRQGEWCVVPVKHNVTVGQLASIIGSFGDCRTTLSIADMSDPLVKALYSTYTSFLPEDRFSYQLNMNNDVRGSFTEFVRTPERGQVSVNISKPGVVKGNHWHHSKNEKFLVVSGTGLIRLRKVGAKHVIEHRVSGERLQVVDIPVGYTHSIENVGTCDMVTIMWANETFDPSKPDTYRLEV